MKRIKGRGICEVKIYRKGKLPPRKPKICEVKIHGRKDQNLRIVKYGPAEVGMNQVVTQVASRLARNTRSFRDGGSACLSLPEWQAIIKMPNVFKILLTEKIYTLAPRLRRLELSNLNLVGYQLLFIPGAKDF